MNRTNLAAASVLAALALGAGSTVVWASHGHDDGPGPSSTSTSAFDDTTSTSVDDDEATTTTTTDATTTTVDDDDEAAENEDNRGPGRDGDCEAVDEDNSGPGHEAAVRSTATVAGVTMTVTTTMVDTAVPVTADRTVRVATMRLGAEAAARVSAGSPRSRL